MRLSILASAALLMALTGATPSLAQAATDGPDADVRCAAVMTFLYLTDEEASDAGLRAVLYFLGRVQAHAPKVDVTARLAQAMATLQAESLDAEIDRCAAVFSGGFDEFEAALPAFTRALKARQTKP